MMSSLKSVRMDITSQSATMAFGLTILLMLSYFFNSTSAQIGAHVYTKQWHEEYGPWYKEFENRQQQTVNTSRTVRRPRIYIYNVTLKHIELSDNAKTRPHPFYAIDFIFPDLLMKSPYVTRNPDEADYFIYPTYLYYNKPDRPPEVFLEEMRRQGPWFDRKSGADHLFVVSDDFGGCAVGFPPKSITIQHFGRTYDAHEQFPCKIFDEFGTYCEPFTRKAEIPDAMEARACHRPGVDIVVPPAMVFEAGHDGVTGTDRPDPFASRNRTTKLFWAGPILDTINEAFYSRGVRQTMYHLYKDRPGFQFHLRHIENYAEELHKSLFCLAPLGFGWGGRVKASILNGCIPFIIQPDVKVEWEEQLPMFDYAVRIPMYMIHKVPDIIDELIKRGKPPKMLDAMRCAWRFHFWGYPQGRAFDLVMCELKARLLGKKLHLNTTTCSLDCGDGQLIDVLASSPYMV